MQSRLLIYKESTVHYCVFGNGPRPAFCFHGYGESADSFLFLEKLGQEFTFFAIDLPWHGRTDWQQGLRFLPEDLVAIMAAIYPFAKGSINPVLLGYSLGGRIALSLYQLMPASFSKLVLIAPDGLVVNPWYWFSTQTFLGKRLFSFTMKRPGWVFAFLKAGKRVGAVNISIFKFVKHAIGNDEVRRLLYFRWVTLRKLTPKLTLIKEQIKLHHTPVRLLYGEFDRIILPSRGEKIRSSIERYCTIRRLPVGHQLLQTRYIADIKDALLS